MPPLLLARGSISSRPQLLGEAAYISTHTPSDAAAMAASS